MPMRAFLKERRRTLAAFVLAPAVILGTLVLMFRGGFREIPIAVVNEDKGVEIPMMGFMSMPEKVLAGLHKETLRVTLTNAEGAKALADKGRVKAVLYFPENFTRGMMAKMENPAASLGAKIELRLDRTAFLTSMAIQLHLMSVFMDLAKEQGGESPLPIDMEKPLYGEGAGPVEYVLPGLLTFLIFLLAGIFAMVLIGGGAKPAQAIAAVTAGSWVQAALLILVSVPLLGMKVGGHYVVAALLVALLGWCGAACGAFLAAAGRGRIPPPIFVLPILFSGAILPLELLPIWLRPLKWAMPPYYAAGPVRELLYRGTGPWEAALPAVVLILIAAAATFGALRNSRGPAAP